MNHRAVAATVSSVGVMGEEGGETHQTQYQFYSQPSAEKCCILPVPFYNNTSIIITVAKLRGGRGRKMKKQRDVKAQYKKEKKKAGHER